KASRDNVSAGWRNKVLNHMMNIFTPDKIRESMSGSDAFSWLRFADASPGDVYKATHTSVVSRAVECLSRKDKLGRLGVAYCEPEDEKYTPGHAMLMIKERANRQPLADITSEGFLNKLMNVGRAAYDHSG